MTPKATTDSKIQAAAKAQNEARNARRRAARAAAKEQCGEMLAADTPCTLSKGHAGAHQAPIALESYFSDRAETNKEAPKPRNRVTTKQASAIIDSLQPKISKAQVVRNALDRGLSIGEAAKETGVPYPYVWDIHHVWAQKKGTK